MKEKKLEDILVDAGFLTNERLEEIKKIQSKTGQKIEKLLLSEDSPNSKEKMQETARRMGVDYVNLETVPVNRNAITKLSAEVARKYHVFPFDISNNLLYLAMQNPDDIFLIDEIKIFTQMEIKPFFADKRMIGKALDYFYKDKDNSGLASRNPDLNNHQAQQVAKETKIARTGNKITNSDELKRQEEQLRKLEEFKKSEQLRKMNEYKQNTQISMRSQKQPSEEYNTTSFSFDESEDSIGDENFYEKEDKVDSSVEVEHIADLDGFIRNVIIKAVYINASNVHIDAVEDHIRVRYRVNEKLAKKDTRISSNYNELVDKFKTMAGIPLSKVTSPQKGRITYNLNDEGGLFITLSVLPTINGEKIMLKLGSIRNQINIENIGFTPNELVTIKNMFDKRAGVIFITGPEESGRSTTARSFIKKLLESELNIITIEEKLDEVIEDISQLELKDNPYRRIDDFIKMVGDYDPDVILIDTSIDKNTLKKVFTLSLSGKLILLTSLYGSIHETLDALQDDGFEDYFIGTALNGIIAQRLVKRLCPECRGKFSTNRKKGDMGSRSRAQLCSRCNSSGFAGKIAVFEVFNMNNEYKQIMSKKGGFEKVKSKLQNEKSTFEENCVRLVVHEDTSIDEVVRLGFGHKLYE